MMIRASELTTQHTITDGACADLPLTEVLHDGEQVVASCQDGESIYEQNELVEVKREMQMITDKMKEVYGEQTCLDLDKLDTRFLGCLPPTTLAALVVAMTSAPDTDDDADIHIRKKLVEDAWKSLVCNVGVYMAVQLLHGKHCGATPA